MLSFVVTEGEKARILSLAACEGVNVSEYLRRSALTETPQEPVSATAPTVRAPVSDHDCPLTWDYEAVPLREGDRVIVARRRVVVSHVGAAAAASKG